MPRNLLTPASLHTCIFLSQDHPLFRADPQELETLLMPFRWFRSRTLLPCRPLLRHLRFGTKAFCGNFPEGRGNARRDPRRSLEPMRSGWVRAEDRHRRQEREIRPKPTDAHGQKKEDAKFREELELAEE